MARILQESNPGDPPAPGDPDWESWLATRTVSAEGVDLSLVRAHLALSPGERLEELERVVNDLLELRGGRWPEDV